MARGSGLIWCIYVLVICVHRSTANSDAQQQQQQQQRQSVVAQIKHQVMFRGTILGGESDERQLVAAFLGVRYAAAPAKRLRFMPPTAYHYASGRVHEAHKLGPVCPRASALPGNTYAAEQQQQQSEDCLNLNIYAPLEVVRAATMSPPQQQQQQLLPVLVVIRGESHGGSGGGGAETAEARGGEFMMVRAHRVLVITFNYRQGLLGFPPKLGGSMRANLGLMDQVAALHWIRDNVAAFGGSPHNVTLFGVRRAAIFVNLLMLSPLAKGLFRRAVMEDGSALSPTIANQLASASNAAAAHYLRVLARLCDCPISNAHIEWADEAKNTHTQHAHNASHFRDANSDAIMFECLRQASVESVMQRVPIDFVHFEHQQQQQQQSKLVVRPRFASHPLVLSALSAGPHNLSNVHSIDSATIARLRTSLSTAAVPQHDSPEFEALASALQASHMHLFGPTIDGVVVPAGDLAALMLANDSAFGQRDLLIGLTQPLLAPLATSDQHVEAQNETQFATIRSSLGDDFVTLDSSSIDSTRAIEIAGSFVRSHYRYHQQEITNSFVQHYLAAYVDDSALRSQTHIQNVSLRNALLVAFHDATIGTPLLRTAIIHALHKLNNVSRDFQQHQLEKWTEMQRNGVDEVRYAENAPPAHSSQVPDQKRLAEELLRLVLASAGSNRWQPRTHVYQVHHDSLRVLARAAQTRLAGEQSSHVFAAIQQQLSAMLNVRDFGNTLSRLSIGCGFDAASETEDEAASLLDKVLARQCRHMHTLLGDFVASSRLRPIVQEPISMSEAMERAHDIEARCYENGEAPMKDAQCQRDLSALTLDVIVARKRVFSADEPDWREYDVFTQQVVTLPSIASVRADTQAQDRPNDRHAAFLAHAAFWSNFVPALNCSRTQPVVPVGLARSAHSAWLPAELIASTSWPTLALNLVFGCTQQTGRVTALDHVLSLVKHTRAQLELRASQIASVMTETTTTTSSIDAAFTRNNHLRMVNASGALTNGSQEDVEKSLGKSMQQQQQPPHNNKHLSTRATHLATSFVLSACALLVSLTLLSGIIVALRNRSRQKQRDNSRKRRGSSSKSFEAQANSSSTSTDTQNHQQQQSQWSCGDNAVPQHQEPVAQNSPSHTNTNAMSNGGVPLQHYDQQQAVANQPIMLPVHFANDLGQSTQLLDDGQMATAVCMMQAPATATLRFSGARSEARSGNSSSATTTTTTNNTIMSSLGTGNSTMKKRVKISDPQQLQRVARRRRDRLQQQQQQHRDEQQQHQLLANGFVSAEYSLAGQDEDAREAILIASASSNNSSYCPVHRSSSRASLSQVSASAATVNNGDKQLFYTCDGANHANLVDDNATTLYWHAPANAQHVHNDTNCDSIYALQQQHSHDAALYNAYSFLDRSNNSRTTTFQNQ